MSRSITIDQITIDDQSDAYVIAEIGHNHQGCLQKCKELFLAAKNAGATAVKLQKRDNQSLYTAEYYNKPYENENSFGTTYGEHREALEFNAAQYRELINYAKELSITFMATAFDFESADFLEELDIPCYKVASGDIRNIPLIRHISRFHKPMIISTGGANFEDVVRAYSAANETNAAVALLQCTASYPAKFEEMDLRVIETYRKNFPDAVIGLSAHDNGIAMSVAAYVLGARIIEKHFTLNRAMKGTDHAFSLEPLGLSKMVRDLRRTRVALGDGCKRIYASEHPALGKMGKQLVAARDLKPGTIVRLEDIAIKSPGGELAPYHIEQVVGTRLMRLLRRDQPFTIADLVPMKAAA